MTRIGRILADFYALYYARCIFHPAVWRDKGAEFLLPIIDVRDKNTLTLKHFNTIYE